MATKTFKIGLSNTDKQNMAQDVYERLLALTFPEYETTESYEVGDFVVYNDQLYKCIGATSGAWDSSKWQLATLNDLVTDIENAVAFVNDKANVDGNYPTMTVGVADQLSPYDDESGDDQDEPFNFQATGTGNGSQPDFSTGAIALMKEKQGNTVVVNQLCSTRLSSGTISDVTITPNVDGSVTLNGTATSSNYAIYSDTSKQINIITGHKYLVLGATKYREVSSTGAIHIPNTSGSNSLGSMTQDGIYSSTVDALNKDVYFVIPNGAIFNNDVFRIKIFDLTQWFNGDIPPDLLDHPENFFRYYQGSLTYNTGTLVNSNGRYIKCIGMNQWDEEWESGAYNTTTGEKTTNENQIRSKNFIKVIPNATYYGYCLSLAGTSAGNLVCNFYDKDKNFIGYGGGLNGVTNTIPNNVCYITIWCGNAYGTTYNNDISINLYYADEARCLTYEPYEVLTNNDTGTEVLRSAGSVKDYKEPDGTIHRLVGVVDLSTLSWNTVQAGVYSCSITKANSKNILNANYNVLNDYSAVLSTDKSIYIGGSTNQTIYIHDSGSTPTGTLYYELAEPTTEQGTSYSENLVIDDFGSMDFQGTNGVPQGNLIFYPVDYKAFIDTLYNYTEGTPSDLALNSELNAKFESYLKSLSGYDASATQVLKNVEGTLTWVTEE